MPDGTPYTHAGPFGELRLLDWSGTKTVRRQIKAAQQPLKTDEVLSDVFVHEQ